MKVLKKKHRKGCMLLEVSNLLGNRNEGRVIERGDRDSDDGGH
jgi:hypothetical protein